MTMSRPSPLRQTLLLPFVLVTSLFLMWGLANNMTDTLLAAFKRILSMSDTDTSWVQFIFYGAYFLLALPGALLIKRFTYKTGILIGLGLFVVGALLFYPASLTMQYAHFLGALFVLACGLSLLETAANPYIVTLGAPESATQRLNLAQSFNPVGSILGVELSRRFILSQLDEADAQARATLSADALQAVQARELAAVMGPYVGMAMVLLVLWIAIALTPMPQVTDAGSRDVRAALQRVWRRRHWRWAVLAQFFYIGAQIGVWSFTIRYGMQVLDLREAEAAVFYSYSLYLFLASRFICTWLMRYLAPQRLLVWLSLLAVGLSLVVIAVPGYPGLIALVGISGCMSLMFPTIYGLGVADLGEDTQLGGAALIMAILGGAVFPPLMGMASDAFGIQAAYGLPLLCFVVVAFCAQGPLKIEGRPQSESVAPSSQQG